MKLRYQSVIVLVLSASLAGCLTREDKLPEVQPFAEGPWGQTVQTPPPSPAPRPVTVRIPPPEPVAEEKSRFGIFKRDPKPAPAPDAEEQPEVKRISSDEASAQVTDEKSEKFGFFRRNKEPKEEQPIATQSAPELKQGPIAESTVTAEPRTKREDRFSLFRRHREPVAEAASYPEPKPEPAPEPKPVAVERSVSFVNDVKPIFQEKCVTCHNKDTLHGRVSLESRELAFQNGPAGAFIVPGDPEASILFKNIVTSKTKENAMPPVGHRVTREEKNTLYAWIMEGAAWPSGSAGRIVADVTPLE